MNAPEKGKIFNSIYTININDDLEAFKEEVLLKAKKELSYENISLDNLEFILLKDTQDQIENKDLNFYKVKITLNEEIPLTDSMKEEWLKRQKDL